MKNKILTITSGFLLLTHIVIAQSAKIFIKGTNLVAETLVSGYSDDYIDANLLQIADLLLGSAIRSCFTGKIESKTIPKFGDLCSKKDVISTPFREMIEKKKIRGSNFIYSGHYRSFTLTKVEFSSEQIIFQELEPLRILNNDLNGLLFADI